MQKNQRIIISSLAVYALTFIINTAIGIAMGFGLDSETLGLENVPISLWIIGGASSMLVTYVVSLWYFSDVTAPIGTKEGIRLGLWIVFVTFILDMLVFFPKALTMDILDELVVYYTHPLFLGSAAAVIATAAFMGYREKLHRPRPGVFIED